MKRDFRHLDEQSSSAFAPDRNSSNAELRWENEGGGQQTMRVAPEVNQVPRTAQPADPETAQRRRVLISMMLFFPAALVVLAIASWEGLRNQFDLFSRPVIVTLAAMIACAVVMWVFLRPQRVEGEQH